MARIAPACAIEIFASSFCISHEHILDAECRRASQCFVEPLFEKVRELLNLSLREIRARRVALCRMTFA
jgi:hypothetical protein